MSEEVQAVEETQETQDDVLEIDGVKITPEKARELFGPEIDRQSGEWRKRAKETEARLKALEAEKEELQRSYMSEAEREQLKREEEKAQIAKERAEIEQIKLENAALKVMSDNSLPESSMEFLAAQTAEDISDKAARFKKLVDKLVADEVSKKLANTGYRPAPTVGSRQVTTWDDYQAMSGTDRAKFATEHPQELNRILQEA